jgi:flagellar biogenesis protein FliO
METIRQTGAVALVLALLLLTLWWLRKRGLAGMTGSLPLLRKSSARRLESLERLPLGPQHTLHLIRFDGATLLISASPSGIGLLASPRADGASSIENSRDSQ